MDLDPLLLSRVQFAVAISFHILFPAFTIGLAAWLVRARGALAARPGARSTSSCPSSGPGSSRSRSAWAWSRASSCRSSSAPTGAGSRMRAGNVLGPAAQLRGGDRVLPRGDLPRHPAVRPPAACRPGCTSLAACMVALGTLISAFWILSANSWMQTPTGHELRDGTFYVISWWEVVFNPSFPYRLAHMVTAAFLTTAFVVAGVSAWHLLEGRIVPHARHRLLDGAGPDHGAGAAADPARRPARAQHASSTSRPRSPRWRATGRRSAARR